MSIHTLILQLLLIQFIIIDNNHLNVHYCTIILDLCGWKYSWIDIKHTQIGCKTNGKNFVMTPHHPRQSHRPDKKKCTCKTTLSLDTD